MSPLLRKILYQRRWFMLWWFAGLTAMSLLMLSFFPSFSSGDIGKSFSTLSPALQKVIGDAASYQTIGGYISQQVFSLRMPLLVTIMSIVLFVGLTVGEEKRGVLETHISLPLSRRTIALSKLTAAILILAAASVGVVVGLELGLLLIGHTYSLVVILKEVVGCLLICLDFGLIAYVFGNGLGRRGPAVGLAAGIAFLSYLLSSLVVAINGLKTVERFSLFHYYATPSAVSLNSFLLLLGIALILATLGTVLFVRRDIRTN